MCSCEISILSVDKESTGFLIIATSILVSSPLCRLRYFLLQREGEASPHQARKAAKVFEGALSLEIVVKTVTVDYLLKVYFLYRFLVIASNGHSLTLESSNQPSRASSSATSSYKTTHDISRLTIHLTA